MLVTISWIENVHPVFFRNFFWLVLLKIHPLHEIQNVVLFPW